MNKEQLGQVIDRKKENLPLGVSILRPDDGLLSETVADWLTFLLGKVYVQHGITKNKERLLVDIKEGRCKPWFATRDGRPIASAALIKQADGGVEIGRAVSLENGVGGLLMLLAVADHVANSEAPIVAEVRISDNFVGVLSGEATQTVCFRHLGLMPQAVVPAFNHGEPNRQEMFLFSSCELIIPEEPLFLPDDWRSLRLLVETALSLVERSIQLGLTVRTSGEFTRTAKWNVVQKEPFCIVSPGRAGSDLSTVIEAVETVSPFTLIPISAKPSCSQAIVECLNHGFIPCGFDRSLDSEGNMVLLLGKLRTGTTLAPIKLVNNIFSPKVEAAIKEIDASFRKEKPKFGNGCY